MVLGKPGFDCDRKMEEVPLKMADHLKVPY